MLERHVASEQASVFDVLLSSFNYRLGGVVAFTPRLKRKRRATEALLVVSVDFITDVSFRCPGPAGSLSPGLC